MNYKDGFRSCWRLPRFARSDNAYRAGRRWKDSQEAGRGAEYFLSPLFVSPPAGGREMGRGTPPPARAGLPKSLEKVKDR